MSFEATRFSEAGLQLLAQLSTSKTLKIKHVYVDSVEHDIIDLEQPPSFWANTTSATMVKVNPEVILAGAKETQARIRVKLSLKSGITETQAIKTIVICACAVESGSEGQEITFCGVIDPVGVEVIYHSGSIKTSTGVSIYFNFSNSSSITVETMENPDLVTASDLDRYLTCHKVSDAYDGDLQEIYGAKFFKNLVSDIYTGLQFGESAEDVYFSINTDDYKNMCFNTHIAGTQGSISNVYKFKNNNLDIVKIDLDRTGNNDIYSTTFSGKIKADSINTNQISSSSTYIKITNDILPDGLCALGSQNNYFNGIFTNGITSRVSNAGVTSEVIAGEGITFLQYTNTNLDWTSSIKYKSGQLTATVQGVDCMSIDGQNTLVYNKIIALGGVDIRDNSVVRDIMPFESENKIGDNTNRFAGIWADSLHGALPTAEWHNTNMYSAEKGTIMCVKPKEDESDYNVERKPGDEFIQSSITSLRMSALDGTTSGTAPYGYYKVISYTDGKKPFLVIFLG